MPTKYPWFGIRGIGGLCEWRAERAGMLGDDATHVDELREANRLYTEIGATGHAERVARELGV